MGACHEEASHEEIEQTKKNYARIPQADEHARRTPHPQSSTTKRPLAAYSSLKQTAAFRTVYRRGRWARGRLLSVGVTATPSPKTQVGLRTRRGLKGAVVRNRLKRQLRAIVRAQKQRLRQGIDLVVVLHPPAPTVTTASLEQEFLALCKQLGAVS
jgi:ribonuclease P protein component